MEKSVIKIIYEVVDEMCEAYCKWPERYGDDDSSQERLWDEHCHHCPMNRL